MLIALDSNCVIYLVEQVPIWSQKVGARLALSMASGESIACSHLTRAECLVGPFRSGDQNVLADFARFFGNPSLNLLSITADVCEQAARLRAIHHFRLPDALNLAAAMIHGCDRFLTNDAQLTRCPGIVVEVLI
jgi:predicted nucleic acid-binding protein